MLWILLCVVVILFGMTSIQNNIRNELRLYLQELSNELQAKNSGRGVFPVPPYYLELLGDGTNALFSVLGFPSNEALVRVLVLCGLASDGRLMLNTKKWKK